MKKTILAATLFTLGASFSANVFAADGTINFLGVVNSTTCTLDTSSQDLTVMLPSVKSADFTAANSAAMSPPVKFTIKASGCDAEVVEAAAIFSSAGNVDPTNGNLNNTDASGTDAQIRIYAADGKTPINLASYGDSAKNKGSITGGNILVDFYANYFSKNLATKPGLLQTSIQYSMQYL